MFIYYGQELTYPYFKAFDKTLLRRYKDENGRAHLDTMNEISRDYDVAVDGEGSVISKLLDYLVLPTVIVSLA